MRRRTSGSGAEDDDGLVSTTNIIQSADGNVEGRLSSIKDRFMDTFEEKSQESSSSSGSSSGAEEEPSRRQSVSSATEKSSQSSPWETLDNKTKTTPSPSPQAMSDYNRKHRARLRSPWACSPVTLSCSAMALLLLFVIVQSFLSRQLDPKGCAMSYMRAAFAKFTDFDTEHTRFASKYSLYLYREGGIDEDTRVSGHSKH